jgi:hypothetical protein
MGSFPSRVEFLSVTSLLHLEVLSDQSCFASMREKVKLEFERYQNISMNSAREQSQLKRFFFRSNKLSNRSRVLRVVSLSRNVKYVTLYRQKEFLGNEHNFLNKASTQVVPAEQISAVGVYFWRQFNPIKVKSVCQI